MSRSYRKNLYYVDGQNKRAGCMNRRKFMRRKANKRVRKSEDISNGSAYKKEFNSWNISDWRFKYNPKNPYAEPIYKIRSK